MHKNDCLTAVMTAAEAAQLCELTRNAVSDACRLGALRGRKSGGTWLVTVADMLAYQHGHYSPDRVPGELQAAFDEAIAQMHDGP